MLRKIATVSMLALWLTLNASFPIFADWPQFQGPRRSGLSTETGLLSSWPEDGPPVAWMVREVGMGYSSPAVVGDRLLITGARGDVEFLFCLDAISGKEIWSLEIGPKFDFEGNSWGGGPRSTPSVFPMANSDDLFVSALSGGGRLVCANLAEGQLLWAKHMMEELAGEVNPIGGGPGTKPGELKIGWGYSWSPLFDQGQLICFPGGPQGAVVALAPDTGDVLWRSVEFTAQASYASIVTADIEEVRQYIVLHNEGLSGIGAQDGKLLWNWQKTYSDVVIPTPIVVDSQHIYVSAGSSPSTCALVKIFRDSANNFQVEMPYASKATRVMKNSVGGSVIVDGYAYGYSDKMGWVCQEVASGNQQWAARGPLKAGSVIFAEGLLYCYDEDNAEVALVEANPKEFVLRSRFQLPESTAMRSPSGRNWTPPVIANGHLLIRDQELLFAFDLRQGDH